jgi:hypothetical protein
VAQIAIAAVAYALGGAAVAASPLALAGVIVAGTALKVVGVAAVNAAFSAMSGKPRAEGTATEFRLDTDAGIPFAFGRVGVAGVPSYRRGYGPTNRYQSIVSTLSGAGPIQSFEAFYSSGELTTFDGSTGAALTGEHVGSMWLQRKVGAQPETAHTSPAGLDAGASATGFTANHKMSGRASAMWTLYENSKLSAYQGGVPQPRHVILGKYGWDPRLDSTWPGGSGSCRLLVPSTWVPIDEGCIAALNWSIGMWEGASGGGTYGVPYACTLVGGIGSSLDGIDVASFINGANVADANDWKLAAYPSTKDDKYTVQAQMLAASGCVPSRLGGKISCVCLAQESASILSVTAADTSGPVEVSLGQSRLERRNTALPKHWSEDHDWQMVQLGKITNSAWVTQDGGITRTRPAEFPYVPDKDQAAQLAYYGLAHDREQISGAVPFKPHMRRIEPGDCFTFQEPGFLLDGIKVRCLSRSYDPMSGGVRITFRQETDAKHAAALAQVGVAPGSSVPATPPDPFVEPPTDFTGEANGTDAKLRWRNPNSAPFDFVTLYRSATDDFGTALAVDPYAGGAGEIMTETDRPGTPGTYYYWIEAENIDGAVSDPVGSVAVTVTSDPPDPDFIYDGGDPP